MLELPCLPISHNVLAILFPWLCLLCTVHFVSVPEAMLKERAEQTILNGFGWGVVSFCLFVAYGLVVLFVCLFV